MGLTETSLGDQAAARNFVFLRADGSTVVSILSQENVWLPGDLEPTLELRNTVTNQDLAHVLICIANELLKAPLNSRLP
jgi:hypothetical protein